MKKKGFTLIELMIVLAIIAILAVVIVPKSGIFKNQAKNAGVITNVNTVRAYLESKTGDSFISVVSDSDSDETNDLTSVLENAFDSTATAEKLDNPFNSSDNAITVIEKDDEAPTTSGTVVVEVDDTTGSEKYIVYGIDNAGAPTSKFEIKK